MANNDYNFTFTNSYNGITEKKMNETKLEKLEINNLEFNEIKE